VKYHASSHIGVSTIGRRKSRYIYLYVSLIIRSEINIYLSRSYVKASMEYVNIPRMFTYSSNNELFYELNIRRGGKKATRGYVGGECANKFRVGTLH